MGTSPRVTTSQKRIIYTRSAWRVHHFEIWSGEPVCRVAALRVQGAVFLWLGGVGEPRLSEAALALPGPGAGPRSALATPLLGAEGAGAALARRLAASLAKPVYVCCGAAFDRFTTPLVERGLIAEIKSRPDCF